MDNKNTSFTITWSDPDDLESEYHACTAIDKEEVYEVLTNLKDGGILEDDICIYPPKSDITLKELEDLVEEEL